MSRCGPVTRLAPMAVVRLFAGARQAVGAGRLEIAAPTVGALVDRLLADHPALAELLPTCALWVNGDSAELDQPIADSDEVAVLPPVSGG